MLFFQFSSLNSCTLAQEEDGAGKEIAGWEGLHPLAILHLVPSEWGSVKTRRGLGSVALQADVSLSWYHVSLASWSCPLPCTEMSAAFLGSGLVVV